MTDLDPCLAGCDAALAEAELLLAILSETGWSGSDLGPVQASIAVLRQQVERLRRMKPPRRRDDRSNISLLASGSPWNSGLNSEPERL